ncbi:lipocalin family protein [Jannaschia donghaensis]|uniref:Outer membrane lipoprotein Blc n=1 Tax=Jannaschia donghaensis TaxID=420998 RepID=A0A0M6YJH3_9RHOB|nr:lipocalin family protein [Jannaschia donghaensis]CTQ49949.1 outer membrane lipoprotein Blc [Jannaschia donghaensis]
MAILSALVVALVACQPTSVETGARATFRDQNVQIASKADFDATRFAGDWYEVARFPGTRGCAGARLHFEAGVNSLRRTARCPDGPVSILDAAVSPLGRLTLAEGSETHSVWVLWTDTTYRTAVLVVPDGAGGQILNRTPRLPVDRLRAALEVLDFNGFDTEALVFR